MRGRPRTLPTVILSEAKDPRFLTCFLHSPSQCRTRKKFSINEKFLLNIVYALAIYIHMSLAHHPATPATSPPQGVDAFARALANIFAPLLQLIANHLPLFGAITWPLHTRITRARNRLLRLLAALAAGRFPRLRAPRLGQKGGPPAPYLPRGKLWLIAKLGYRAAGYAAQFQHLLDQPETLAILAAAPPHARAAAARTLRPLARLLGIILPAILQPPPAPARPKPIKQPRPKPAPLPPLLPLYPQRRPRPMPFMNFTKKPRPA